MNTHDDPFQACAMLAGRLLLAAVFLPAGIGKAMALARTAGYIASKGLPAPVLLVLAAAGADRIALDARRGADT